jgi:hypothetical protein
MKRVLVFMEGWGCRKKGKREYCRFVVNDIVTVTLWRNYSRGNRIVLTDVFKPHTERSLGGER